MKSQPRFIVCLAVYLLFKRAKLKSDEFYSLWYQNLPQRFNLPFFWSDDYISHLPVCLRHGVSEMRRQLDEDYHEVCELVTDVGCSYEDFKWAFSIVHTRCLKWPAHIELSHTFHVRGDIDYALIPFADFINHSSDVLVKTRIKNGHFQLVSWSPQNKDNQIFMNYGFHSNAYFLLQYGFVPSDNPHDFIEIAVDQVLFITQYPDCDKKTLTAFFEANKDSFLSLYVYTEGISMSLIKFFYIVISEESLWSHILNDCSDLKFLSSDYHFSAKSLFLLTLRFNLDMISREQEEFCAYCETKSREDTESVNLFLNNWISILTNNLNKISCDDVTLQCLLKI